MPKLHIANTFFEWELQTEPKVSLVEAFLQNAIFLQLQFLPLLYADSKEGLLLSDLPDPQYWSTLKLQGISNPSPFTYEGAGFSQKEEVESWAPSQLIATWADARGLIYPLPKWEVVKEVNSKHFSFENSPKLPGATLLTGDSQARHWMSSLKGMKVLKTCFGVSGNGHLIIDEDCSSERIAAFLQNQWKRDLPIIAEPWLKRILDFSTQWHIKKSGQITYLGSTICQNDQRGQYQFSEVGEEKKLFHTYLPYLIEHQKKIEPLLMSIKSKGFFGNLGIDAMLYESPEDPQSIFLHPVVEINARKTMGWAALMYQKLYFPKKKIRFSYRKNSEGYLPNFLVLKNGKKVSFARNLAIEVYN